MADPAGSHAPPATWRELLAAAEQAVGAGADGRRIIERASGLSAGELWSRLDDTAPERARALVESMVARRAAGEPLQYVLGVWGFRSLDLVVDRRVLIPRPETEALVDVALGEIDRLHRPGSGTDAVVADLGTGSGAIALSVALERAHCEVWGADVSPDALAVARANLAGIGSAAATRVTLAQGHWFEALPELLRGRLDVVVANPPYVAAGEDLPDEVAEWEPELALRSGAEGLDAITDIVAEAPVWLARPGSLVLELAPTQASAALALAREAGTAEALIRPDLAGRDRILVARW